LPAGYVALDEIMFLTRMALACSTLPGVLCFFNPSGEVVLAPKAAIDVWTGCARETKTPVQLWSHVRMYKLDPSYLLMDTVGNGQLDRPDVEAIFSPARYKSNAVAYYPQNVLIYLVGPVELKSGQSIDGPNETGLTWTIERLEGSRVSPPRAVIRLMPKSDSAQIRSVPAPAAG
jgi:hypothetical protein